MNYNFIITYITYTLTFNEDGEFRAAIAEETYNTIQAELSTGMGNLTPLLLRSLFGYDACNDISAFVVNTVMPMIQTYVYSYVNSNGSYTIKDGYLNLNDGSNSSSFFITMEQNNLVLVNATANDINCLAWMDIYPETFNRIG